MRGLISALLFAFLLMSCSEEEEVGKTVNKPVEILLSVNSFTKNGAGIPATTDIGTEEEQRIDNLYVFLFSDSDTKSYYIDDDFSEGAWTAEKIVLKLTQKEAATRNVYIVANCAAIKTKLDAVNTIDDLNAVFSELSLPWSPELTTPILMVGNKNSHNFETNNQLNKISLKRVLAKLQLHVNLSTDQQDVKSAYKYRFVNFDKATYVIKPNLKPADLVSSDWYSLTEVDEKGGKVTSFTIETYLNESDVKGTAIEVKIPDKGSSLLPPPEFGDESHRLFLPDRIIRNDFYLYDISFEEQQTKQ